jgi:hypothetical protein
MKLANCLVLIIASSVAWASDYGPGLGEIMSVIQQHHAKLYYAGSAQNWDLAAYELDEIKEGLEDASKAHHEFKTLKTPLTELVPAMTKAEIEGLSKAIEAKSRPEFSKRFANLTHACNECHQTVEHPFIVIQEPTRPEFTNQRFTK